jgi:hypothetical protein
MILLKSVKELMEANGAEISNIDATLIIQKPKIAPYIDIMRKNIADVMGCDISEVNVKATTEERLGFTGREEGVSAHAVVLLEMKYIRYLAFARYQSKDEFARQAPRNFLFFNVQAVFHHRGFFASI